MKTTLGEPTASFIFEPDMALAGEPLRAAISAATGGEERARFVDATPIATALMGDSIATNPFMVGYACQMGALPLSRAAHDSDKVAQIVAEMASVAPESIAVELEDVIAKRVEFLADYQNAAYAERYRSTVEKVASAEQESTPGTDELALTVRPLYV
jgi:indolepyruvate ferredoxin oxidoreductase